MSLDIHIITNATMKLTGGSHEVKAVYITPVESEFVHYGTFDFIKMSNKQFYDIENRYWFDIESSKELDKWMAQELDYVGPVDFLQEVYGD